MGSDRNGVFFYRVFRHLTVQLSQMNDAELFYIFGYGSLIWRPNFEYKARKVCLLRGFKRRFWQHSEDHRGVPGSPGRVVTCVPRDTLIEHDLHYDTEVWGVAYGIRPEDKATVLDYLQIREAGGYTIIHVDLFDSSDATEPMLKNALLFTGTIENEYFVGPNHDDGFVGISKQIATSVGPSGKNSEYLLRLAEALREHGIVDQHVFDLEELVKKHLETQPN